MDRPPRKSPPRRICLAALIRQRGTCAYSGRAFTVDDALAGRIHFDHDPPLEAREVNEAGDDYIPPQHDIATLFACLATAHDAKTHGPGGEKRITTRGSDTGERARRKSVAESHDAHLRYMENKAPGQKRPRKPGWPKRKFPRRWT